MNNSEWVAHPCAFDAQGWEPGTRTQQGLDEIKELCRQHRTRPFDKLRAGSCQERKDGARSHRWRKQESAVKGGPTRRPDPLDHH